MKSSETQIVLLETFSTSELRSLAARSLAACSLAARSLAAAVCGLAGWPGWRLAVSYYFQSYQSGSGLHLFYYSVLISLRALIGYHGCGLWGRGLFRPGMESQNGSYRGGLNKEIFAKGILPKLRGVFFHKLPLGALLLIIFNHQM